MTPQEAKWIVEQINSALDWERERGSAPAEAQMIKIEIDGDFKILVSLTDKFAEHLAELSEDLTEEIAA